METSQESFREHSAISGYLGRVFLGLMGLPVAIGLFSAVTLTTLLPQSLYADSILVPGEPVISASEGDGQGGELVRAAYPNFNVLSKVLSPSVVNISVENDEEEPSADESEQPGFPFFKKEKDTPGRSLGSGFIVSSDGYVVTNNHVIENADKIIVRLLDDKTEYVAKLIGKDDKTDLALIKIKSKEALPAVFAGDSDKLEVGEWVLAIGNQFQLGQTVTAGIVSAKSRKVPTKASGPYDDFIQTDASINPGSSGGPLFNTRGQVIGINTAIFSPGRSQFGGTGFNIGIGFAIPINMAKRIIEQLKEHGKVTRGLLGVIIQSISPEIAQAMELRDANGALVADVMDGSPAGKAGFKVKDVIVKFDGHPVRDHDDLPILVANTPVDSVVKVEVVRNGVRKTLRPTISELSADFFSRGPAQEKPKSNKLGLIVQDVTEDIAKSLGLDLVQGVIISDVESGSAAAKAGLSRGDVILELANKPVRDKAALDALLSKLKKGKPILAFVKRKEGTRFLTLKIK